jgi:hypothetical protein
MGFAKQTYGRIVKTLDINEVFQIFSTDFLGHCIKKYTT